MTTKTRASKLLSSIVPSATLAVSAKAKELKAAGESVIGFGAGEPDFPTPDYIVEAAVRAARQPKSHQYTPTKGLPELRQAIAEKTLRDSGYEVDVNNILVTNGGKQAVFESFAALLDPGDEVLLPTPYWTTYPEAITLAGGHAVKVMAGSDQGYKVSVEQLEQARTSNTKALLVCSPSNPTGAVYSPQELIQIGKWALEHGIWVITDEIYEHLVYDEFEPTHMVKLLPELADQTIVLNGVAKTYAMTGWRVGWMIGPSDIISAATNYQSHVCSNVCNVAQEAALAAVSGDLSAVDQMHIAFDRRRKTAVQMLRQIPDFVTPTPHGAFYVYPDVSAVLGKTLRGEVMDSSATLAKAILTHAKVAVVPGEAFGPGGFLRLSYALSDDNLKQGIGRMQELMSELS